MTYIMYMPRTLSLTILCTHHIANDQGPDTQHNAHDQDLEIENIVYTMHMTKPEPDNIVNIHCT